MTLPNLVMKPAAWAFIIPHIIRPSNSGGGRRRLFGATGLYDTIGTRPDDTSGVPFTSRP